MSLTSTHNNFMPTFPAITIHPPGEVIKRASKSKHNVPLHTGLNHVLVKWVSGDLVPVIFFFFFHQSVLIIKYGVLFKSQVIVLSEQDVALDCRTWKSKVLNNMEK